MLFQFRGFSFWLWECVCVCARASLCVNLPRIFPQAFFSLLVRCCIVAHITVSIQQMRNFQQLKFEHIIAANLINIIHMHRHQKTEQNDKYYHFLFVSLPISFAPYSDVPCISVCIAYYFAHCCIYLIRWLNYFYFSSPLLLWCHRCTRSMRSISQIVKRVLIFPTIAPYRNQFIWSPKNHLYNHNFMQISLSYAQHLIRFAHRIIHCCHLNCIKF